MIKIFLILFMSFILESNLSVYIPINTSFFNSFFVLSSLIVINDLILEKDKFYILSIFIGVFYDLVFTNRIGFSLLTFLLTAIFIKNNNLFKKFSKNILNYLSIFVFYRLVSFFVLFLIGYVSFDFFYLLKSIYSSIILNIIYVYILSYFFLKKRY